MKNATWEIGTQIHLVTANDTNPHGTIFGGKVMELADQAAAICARRYCQKPVLTASLDRIDFLHPIHVGEEAHVTPHLLYAYKHSMQVHVEVRASCPLRGVDRQTSKILFTFVAIDEKNLQPSEVPSWQGPETPEAKAFRTRYLELKNGIRPIPDNFPKEPVFMGKKPTKSIQESFVENHHLVMPGDQNVLGFLFAGRYLSWVDIVGSLAASRHCAAPVVTASIEEVHFRERVPKGSTLRLTAKPIFAAKTSVQIQVTGWMWSKERTSDIKIADAYLTFVALHPKTGKPLIVPQLSLASDEERETYLEGQWRYQNRSR